MDVIRPALSPFATRENASLIIGVFTDVGRDSRELWDDCLEFALEEELLAPDEKEISRLIILPWKLPHSDAVKNKM